jgi:hypothetical protein
VPAVRPAPNHDTWLDRRHAELTRFMQTSVLTGCKIPAAGYDSVSIEGKLVTIVTRLAAHNELAISPSNGAAKTFLHEEADVQRFGRVLATRSGSQPR